MKKKKDEKKDAAFDPELLRMYLMGGANPSRGNKFESAIDVVDLHLEGPVATTVRSQDALFYQMEQFEKALDSAIAAGKLEFRVVHGLGKGKLKEEIYKLLKKHPQVKSFSNDYHSKYGYGSTLISLK